MFGTESLRVGTDTGKVNKKATKDDRWEVMSRYLYFVSRNSSTAFETQTHLRNVYALTLSTVELASASETGQGDMSY